MRYAIHVMAWGSNVNGTDQVTVQRRVFDRLLARQAETCGAELLTGAQVREVRVEDVGRVTALVRLSGRGEVDLLARSVVFADGPHTLGRRLGLGYRPVPGAGAVALACEIAWPNNPLHHYELHYGAGGTGWGYAWIFPYRNVVNVGVGCRITGRGPGIDLQASLAQLLANGPGTFGLLRERKVLTRRGGYIPLQPARRLVGPSCLVAGDAAGLVYPLLAAGLDSALLSGELAGQALSAALASGDLSTAGLAAYARNWRATPTARGMALQALLARLARPLAYCDRHALSKIVQLAHMGGNLTVPDKFRALCYPFLGAPRLHSRLAVERTA